MHKKILIYRETWFNFSTCLSLWKL